MLVRNKKQFMIGVALTVGFFAILFIMFTPIFGGTNAFHAADGLFNSISKASANQFETVRSTVQDLDTMPADQELTMAEDIGQNVALLINETGAQATYADGTLSVSGEINVLLERMVDDARIMFDNEGSELREAYGIDPMAALYAWWMYANTASKKFLVDERFDTSKALDEVRTRAIEVSYNYYGIDPTPPSERVGIIIFALVFYVIYTMWWGFAIFELFAGLGLTMSKGAKKEA